ncbi:hypothetical protein [Tenacibaculum xiamenense]|uniref:hypothetical protein n=1 Tax=Tenacibaculum xiamenense TaxID=1261553 RepID=UPI0038B58076
MLKTVLNLGNSLDKTQQKAIIGGRTIYLFGGDCYRQFCSNNPPALPPGTNALCAHPFDCDSNIFEP